MTDENDRKHSAEAENGEECPSTFVTSEGIELHLRAIPPLLTDKLRLSLKKPLAPTYEAEMVGGGVEIHDHNETTEKSSEEAQKWSKYLRDLENYSGEMNVLVNQQFVRRGVDYSGLDLPEDEEWIIVQESLGLVVPEDGLQRKWHYVETEALATREDVTGFITKLMLLTTVSEEVMAIVEESFRRTVAGAGLVKSEDSEGSVELQQPLLGDEDGEGVESEAD